MKDLIKNAFFVLLLFISGSVYSQAVVSVNLNNYIYAGVENPVSIAVAGINSDFIEISCDHAIIKKQDGVNYQIMPQADVRQIQLSIFNKKGDEKELITTYQLRVLSIPAPEISLGNKVLSNEAQEINKALLFADPCLRLTFESDIERLTHPLVKEFKIGYKANGNQVEHKIEGYKIPVNIINELRLLPENTEVEFIDITYKVSNESSYNLEDVKIILK